MKEAVTFSWNKKGISIMIGYILLITSAIIMSAIVYQWLKSYVPTDSINCPDGTSLFVLDSSCIKQSDDTYKLILDIRNNGRFDIGGYFIYGRDVDDKEQLATIDLSPNLISGEVAENAVIFYTPGEERQNLFDTGDEDQMTFTGLNKLYSIEILPIRFQIIDNKRQLVSCSNSKITEDLSCGLAPSEIPEDCGNGVVDAGEECDSVPGCGSDCKHLPGYACNPSLNICS